MQEIIDFFKMNDVKYKENFDLSRISPVRIGGKALFVAYPRTTEEMIKIIDFLENLKINYKIVGRMSNVLISRDLYDGIIIRTDLMSLFEFSGESAYVNAGISLPQIAKLAADAGLSGLEQLSGIPGSIGGAIRGNAGAFGREISELVSDVTIFDKHTSRVIDLSQDEIDFSYRRSSLIDKKYIILGATLLLSASDSLKIKGYMADIYQIRLSTQPYNEPSLGSVFKWPVEGLSAAKLIDDCGLKGYRIGKAKISEKHAGFIINCGGATAQDYLSLVDYAADEVYKKFGINLEKEIEIF